MKLENSSRRDIESPSCFSLVVNATAAFNFTGGKGWGVHHKTLSKQGYSKRPLSAARIRQEKGHPVF